MVISIRLHIVTGCYALDVPGATALCNPRAKALRFGVCVATMPAMQTFHRTPRRRFCVVSVTLFCMMFMLSCRPPSPTAAKSDLPHANAAPPSPIADSAFASFAAPVQSPLVDAHRAAIVANKIAVLALPDLKGDAEVAQTLALADPMLLGQFTQQGRPERLRAEVFAVYPLRESELTPQLADCLKQRCQRIDIYDFARNQTVIGVVDPVAGIVRTWRMDAGLQPEIPDRLKAIAIDLAIRSPEVSEALGGIAPQAGDAQMASTKTALNGTRCERSRHLCAAPTFVQGNIAVWAIVDLTDFRIAGVQWTDVGQRTALSRPTEQSVADLAIMQNYCEKNTKVEREQWQFDYILTASDGLRIGNVRYQSKPLFESVKLVDWHVNYSTREGFGYSDAVGCPMFSSAAVVPFAPPEITPISEHGKTVGFQLLQEFRSNGWPAPCNYSYRQAFQFYQDGRFRPTAASIGAGCGDDGTYRPVMRIEPAGEQWQVQAIDGGKQRTIDREQWLTNLANQPNTATALQLQSGDFAFRIEPSTGQFGDGGRGDNPYWYLTHRDAKRDEGASDLLSLGSCCNSNHEQGPERFIDQTPEALSGSLVLWYVAQLKNDVRVNQEYCWAYHQLIDGVPKTKAFPCVAGPMFVPVAKAAVVGQ